jgi:chaperonin GroES
MAKLNLRPAPGYLIIEPLEKELKTASGIYLPDNAGEKPQKGKVVAVGEKVKHDNFEEESFAKVDDTVLYKKWGGNEVKEDGRDYLIVKFEDILAVVTA